MSKILKFIILINFNRITLKNLNYMIKKLKLYSNQTINKNRLKLKNP